MTVALRNPSSNAWVRALDSYTAEIEAWRAAGKITQCPTAFAAETRQARELTLEQRAALAPRPRLDVKASWNTLGGLTGRKAPVPVEVGMPSTAPAAPEPREPARPVAFLAGIEITTRVFSNGLSEVTTIDHQGRHFVSRFGPARNGLSNYHGTTWVNRAAFESVSVK